MDVNEQQLQSLADKLNALDLTADEEELLVALLDSGDEVSGFQDRFGVQIRGFNIGMPPSTIAVTTPPNPGITLGGGAPGI